MKIMVISWSGGPISAQSRERAQPPSWKRPKRIAEPDAHLRNARRWSMPWSETLPTTWRPGAFASYRTNVQQGRRSSFFQSTPGAGIATSGHSPDLPGVHDAPTRVGPTESAADVEDDGPTTRTDSSQLGLAAEDQPGLDAEVDALLSSPPPAPHTVADDDASPIDSSPPMNADAFGEDLPTQVWQGARPQAAPSVRPSSPPAARNRSTSRYPQAHPEDWTPEIPTHLGPVELAPLLEPTGHAPMVTPSRPPPPTDEGRTRERPAALSPIAQMKAILAARSSALHGMHAEHYVIHQGRVRDSGVVRRLGNFRLEGGHAAISVGLKRARVTLTRNAGCLIVRAHEGGRIETPETSSVILLPGDLADIRVGTDRTWRIRTFCPERAPRSRPRAGPMALALAALLISLIAHVVILLVAHPVASDSDKTLEQQLTSALRPFHGSQRR